MSKKLLLATVGLVIGLQSATGLAASIKSAEAAIAGKDYAKALEELQPLVKEGNADATNLMGRLYENGWGVQTDIEQAKTYYNRGARTGHIASVNSLRALKNKDYKIELDNLLPQAEAGNANAQNRVGEMFEFGHGAKRNPEKAFQFYQQAADQGLVAAQHNLGRSFNFGTGTSQDFVEAEKWYLQAAKQGYTNSMFFLGTLYSNGYGQDKSHHSDIIAYAWMHNAALLGDGTAASIESRLLMKLEGTQLTEAKDLAAAYAEDYVAPFKN